MAKKKNKEKVVYYDDNSTIADMSSVTRDGKKRVVEPKAPPTVSKWRTFFSAFKMMLVPTGIALGVLGLLYLLIMLMTGNLF